jgi:carbohydrate diacid regulator
LIYRLKKIIDDTGRDPKNFEDALVLQVALWIYQKEQKERKP